MKMINNLCVETKGSDMQIDTIKEAVMPVVLYRDIRAFDKTIREREEKQSDSSSN